MDSSIRFQFEPVRDDAMRFAVLDHRGEPVDDFPPEGPFVETAAFGRALLDATRRLLALAWRLGQADNREIEQVREYAVQLRHALADAKDY